MPYPRFVPSPRREASSALRKAPKIAAVQMVKNR